jgi:hypothetical protein
MSTDALVYLQRRTPELVGLKKKARFVTDALDKKRLGLT